MNFSVRSAVMAMTLLSAVVLSPINAAAAPPDAGLYTAYFFSSGYASVDFFVCGSVPGSDGCYGTGSLGPFGHAGAMAEGGAHIVGNVVKHDTYVVDVAGGPKGTEVVLYQYEITNTVNPPYDSVTYKLVQNVSLPLAGGAKERCSLAANSGFLFVGTSKSTFVVRVAKEGFALESFYGFSNNPTVAAITTDDRDFVVVAFGANAGGPGGNIEFDSAGEPVSDGGGAWFTLPRGQGISTKDLPTELGPLPADQRLSVRLRPETATP
jgi:hypothetical protein